MRRRARDRAASAGQPTRRRRRAIAAAPRTTRDQCGKGWARLATKFLASKAIDATVAGAATSRPFSFQEEMPKPASVGAHSVSWTPHKGV